MIAGTRVGRYVLLGKFAAGGMAEVFLARQDGPHSFSKTVVIKRILQDLSQNPEFVRMFLDEARLAALINHPNVASIYELGEDPESGLFFMAMEFVDGTNLKRVVHGAMKLGELLAPALCARIVADACAGLDFAHDLHGADGEPLGIVHRDVSPENILVSYSGQVKVVDFGVAKATLSEGRTQAGQLKGKFSYMPPEQITGQPLDRRGDIWALGVVLYWMLTGVKPFRGENEGEIIHRIVNLEPPPLLGLAPSVPAPLVDIVTRALTKDPAQRYPTARAMQDDLEGWLGREGQLVNTAVLGDYMNRSFPPKTDPDRLMMRSLMTGSLERTPSKTEVSKFARSPSMPPSQPPLGSPKSASGVSIDIADQGDTDEALAVPPRTIPLEIFVGVLGAIALVVLFLLLNGRHSASATPRVEAAAVATAPPPEPSPPGITPLAPVPDPVTVAAAAPAPKRGRSGGARNGTGQGAITIEVSPWAEVFLDDRPAGTTPMQPIEADPGTHHVRLVNAPLHVDRDVTVVVRPGRSAHVRVSLDAEE